MEEEPGKTLYTFYETPAFSEDLAEFLGEDALDLLFAIQADLIADPQRWPIVKGTGGARKGRVADPKGSKGKSGGFRYLYLYLEYSGQIYLLFLFAKSDQENLSNEQKMRISRWVDAIKKEKK